MLRPFRRQAPSCRLQQGVQLSGSTGHILTTTGAQAVRANEHRNWVPVASQRHFFAGEDTLDDVRKRRSGFGNRDARHTDSSVQDCT